MATQPTSCNSTAPRWSVLLPLAYVAHLCEEWWGGPGFSAWTHAVLGAEVSPERFILINAVALPLFAMGTVCAIRNNRFAWFAAALAALLVLNGALHLLAVVGFATYSPGTVTGVLLYLPLGGLVLRHMSRNLPGPVFARAVLAGIVAHALIAVAAFAQLDDDAFVLYECKPLVGAAFSNTASGDPLVQKVRYLDKLIDELAKGKALEKIMR